MEIHNGRRRTSQTRPPAPTSARCHPATRPPGTHYDYTVDSLMAAAFYDLRWQVREDLAQPGEQFVEVSLPCQADVNNDGVLDNGDIGAFVSAFLAGCP